MDHDEEDPNSAFFRAAVTGDSSALVGIFAEGQVVVELEDLSGNSALHLCALHGRNECISLLLGRGLSIDSRNLEGLTALNVAAKEGFASTVALLLSSGADIEARCNDGLTPLIWSSCTGKLDSLRVLLENGANVNAKDNSGFTCWLWAAFNGYIDCLTLLVQYDPDMLAQTNDGKTAKDLSTIAFNEALSSGHYDLIPDLNQSVYFIESMLERNIIREQASLVETTKRGLVECKQRMHILNDEIRDLEGVGNYPEASSLHDEYVSLSSRVKCLERNLAKAQKRYSHEFWMQELKDLIENFNYLWDKYLLEYDSSAKKYLEGLYQTTVINVPLEKIETSFVPSKALAAGRAKEKSLVRRKCYDEAAALKKILDQKEQREIARKHEKNAQDVAAHVELLSGIEELKIEGILNRIKTRRKEHRRQRDLDSDRLMRLREGKDSIPILECREFSDAKPLHLQTPWDSSLKRPCIVTPSRPSVDLAVFAKTKRNTAEYIMNSK